MKETIEKIKGLTLKAINEVHESNYKVEKYVIEILKKLQLEQGRMD